MFKNATDETGLLGRLRMDDESALAELHRNYWKPLFQAAFRVLQDQDAAQDAVQEVFISLWERRKELNVRSLPGYLYGAVRHQVLNCLRREELVARLEQRLLEASANILRTQPFLFFELQSTYERVLQSLPSDQREYFRMNREQGLTYEHIAREKHISVKTVEKKMSNALKAIRMGLDRRAVMILTAFLQIPVLL